MTDTGRQDATATRSRGRVVLGQLHALATHHLVVAAATVVLALLAVVGLALPWGRTIVSAAATGAAGSPAAEDSDMVFTVSGFGMITGAFRAIGLQEIRVDATLLSLACGLLLLVLAAAVLIGFTALRRVASIVVAACGAGFVGYAVYGLVTALGVEDEFLPADDGAGGQSTELLRSLLGSVHTTTGPGEYVVLVAGLLLLVLGAYFALRSAYPWSNPPDDDALKGAPSVQRTPEQQPAQDTATGIGTAERP
ncbi:Trp biosynthesis-associated membrane protein [Corynebacterium sp. AOP40-9SA-29]|uniref:Trp biosynthesis-associated membrane protein n=1 Tax=Corynebacterium sp. AOP40-9SA-29 TaxID=3457677 RepID=UPI00403336F5